MALSGAVRVTSERFVARLVEAYGADLVSVALYGSAARGDHDARRSDINLLVVLHDAGIISLRKIAPALARADLARVRPIFLTREGLRASLDVFPLEFLDMKEARIVLHGPDLLGQLNVAPTNLRHQCEHELRAKLLSLSRLYVSTAGPRTLRAALYASSAAVLHVMRSLLSAARGIRTSTTSETIEAIRRELGIDTAPFTSIAELRARGARPGHAELDGLFASFCASLDALITVLDGLRTT